MKVDDPRKYGNGNHPKTGRQTRKKIWVEGTWVTRNGEIGRLGERYARNHHELYKLAIKYSFSYRYSFMDGDSFRYTNWNSIRHSSCILQIYRRSKNFYTCSLCNCIKWSIREKLPIFPRFCSWFIVWNTTHTYSNMHHMHINEKSEQGICLQQIPHNACANLLLCG